MELPRMGVERDVGQAITALKRGSQLLKYGRRGRPKFCPFRVSNDETTLIWFSGKEERQLRLSYITKIIPGQRTPSFQRYPRPEKECQSFSLIYGSEERSLDLICKDKDEAEVWFVGLKALISNQQFQRLKIDTKSEGSDAYSPLRGFRDSPLTSPYGSSDNLQDSNSTIRSHSPFTSPSREGLYNALSSAGELCRLDTGASHDDNLTATSKSLPSVDPLRISMSSAVSSSSHGSGLDDADALGDVFIWGEGIGDGYVGGGHYRIGSCVSQDFDALLPKALRSAVVLDVSTVTCGSRHAALVTKQGEVFCWGEGSGGRLGHGIDADVSEPQLVESMSSLNVEIVACGEFHTCAVTLSGDLYTWGDGTQNAGLLGHGNNVSHWIPKRVNTPLEGVRIASVSCGAWHTALVTSAGQLFTFGDGTFGVLGHGDKKSVLSPKEVDSLRGLKTVAVSCGIWHTAAIVEVIAGYSNATSSGKLFTWGDGDKFRLGHGDKEQKLFPTCVAAVVDYNFRQVACGHSLTAALTTTGRVFTMGSSIHGQLGEPEADGKVPVLVDTKLAEVFVEEIDCGAHHVAVLSSKTEVYTWGRGANGRLGHGDVLDRTSPTLVEALRDKQVKSIACGTSFTAVVCLHKAISGADQSVCTGCKQAFGFTRKRHNCYNCGCSFCHGCSSRKAFKASLAPNPSKAYRVCEPCFLKLQKSSNDVRTYQAPLARRSSWKYSDTGRPSGSFEKSRATSTTNGSVQRSPVNVPTTTTTTSKAVSRAASPRVARRSSPPRSSTPNPTRAGLVPPGNVADELKKKNELLQRERSQLKAQIDILTSRTEQRERELQRSAQKVQEAVLLAGEETAKRRAAKEVIKSLTAELKELAERLPRSIRPVLPGFLDDSPNNRIHDENVNGSRNTNEGFNNQDEVQDIPVQETRDAPPPVSEAEDWVEQDQPGVYITLASLPTGQRDLRRVRFSRRRFTEREAEEWWQEQRHRIYQQYNIRVTEKTLSSAPKA